MAELITGARTLAEWGQFFTGEGMTNEIIELLTEENSILDDIPWVMGNMTDGHKTTIRTGLPTPVYTTLYDGPQPTKSKIAQVKDATGMLEARSEIDTKLVKLNGNSAAYRLQESRSHMEALRQKTAETLIYGSLDADEKTYNGLSIRYPYKDSPNVIDALGTGTKCTDIWIIVWGPMDVHGIFPKGTMAGLEHQDKGEEDQINSSSGGTYYAYVDMYMWMQGLTVRDWRSVVRLANIDTTKLSLKPADAGYVDLQVLMIKAKNTLKPISKIQRAVAYVNEDIMTALEIQAINPNNVYLRYGEWQGSKRVLFMHGIPVRLTEAILSTQTALTAAP